MITIVSGPIDSGKTSLLAKHFAEQGRGDGYLSEKFYKNNQVQGYVARRLSTQATLPWLIRDDDDLKPLINEARIGPFKANLETLWAMEKAYEAMIKKGVSPMYLDEIGEWELSGQGFDAIFRKMVLSKCDLVVAVRKELLTKVIERYGLKDYCILWSSK